MLADFRRDVSDPGPLSERDSEPSQALTSYLTASPTITERLSNNLPDNNKKKRLEEKIASLDVKIKAKASGNV